MEIKEIERSIIKKYRKTLWSRFIDSINEFKSKIKIVSEEESTKLGAELFDLINSKNFKDET